MPVKTSVDKLYRLGPVSFACPYATTAPDAEIRLHGKPLLAIDAVFCAELPDDRGFGVSVYQELKDCISGPLYSLCLSLNRYAPCEREHA